MVDQKLKGFLSDKDKSSNHGLSCSQTAKQKRMIDLHILAHHLQQRLRSYEDPYVYGEIDGRQRQIQDQ